MRTDIAKLAQVGDIVLGSTKARAQGEARKEANETFYLDLFGNSGNSMFMKNRGLGTILNDD